MFDKIQYKLWKHLNKKMNNIDNLPPPRSTQPHNQNATDNLIRRKPETIFLKIFYKAWKHLNKKKYVSKAVYKIHKHLSKFLIKKNIISSFSPLKQRKERFIDDIRNVLNETFKNDTTYKINEYDALISFRKSLNLKILQNSIETLVVGSSHGYYGYRAEEKYHEFNACEPSQDLYYSYEIYKKFSDAPRLKNIILFFSVFSPGLILELIGECWRCDFYYFFYDIPYRFFGEYSAKKIEPLFTPFILKSKKLPLDLKYLGNSDYSYVSPINAKTRAEGHMKSNKRRNENQTWFVEMAIKLAREKNQNLYVVIPPARSDYISHLPPFEEMFDELTALEKDIKILSFLRDSCFLDSDFIDTDHLNEEGAKKLTMLIREKIL